MRNQKHVDEDGSISCLLHVVIGCKSATSVRPVPACAAFVSV